MKHQTRSTTALIAAALLGLTVAATIGGCNLAAGAYFVLKGPDKTPAVFTLPKECTAVIALDDRGSVVPQRSLRDMIGKTAEEEILKQKLVKEMVAARLASAVMARERTGEPMGIAEIGKAVSADIVIYVVIDSFTLSEDGQTLSPVATGRVKIVESKTGTRLGPPEADPAGFFPLSVNLPPQGAVSPTTANELALLQELARVTGVYLSRMFWDAEVMTAPTKLEEK